MIRDRAKSGLVLVANLSIVSRGVGVGRLLDPCFIAGRALFEKRHLTHRCASSVLVHGSISDGAPFYLALREHGRTPGRERRGSMGSSTARNSSYRSLAEKGGTIKYQPTRASATTWLGSSSPSLALYHASTVQCCECVCLRKVGFREPTPRLS